MRRPGSRHGWRATSCGVLPVDDAALMEVEQPLAQLDCDELDLLRGQEAVDLGLSEAVR